MESRAKLLGHPIHQMLIPLPLGLLVMAVIFDALALATDWDMTAVSFWNIVAGIATGLLAAVFGLVGDTAAARLSGTFSHLDKPWVLRDYVLITANAVTVVISARAPASAAARMASIVDRIVASIEVTSN